MRNIFGFKIGREREVVIELAEEPVADTSQKNTSDGGKYTDRAQYVSNESQGMKIAAVFRAVSLISNSIAVLPLSYKRRDNALNYFKPYNTGPGSRLYYLLTIKPNRRQTSFIFMSNLVSQVLLQGNAYVYPKKDALGYITELILLSKYSCQYDTWSDSYWVEDTINGVSGKFSSNEILHFKNISLDGGMTGVSTITYAAQTLSISATANKETLSRFATGGKIKAIFHNDNSGFQGTAAYDDDEMKSAANSIQDQLNSGQEIIHVPGEGKLDQLSMSSVDMQFLESVKLNITEIARFFNVPKAKLFDDSNASYKSPEAATVDFYSDCLSPIITMIEQEFMSKLIAFERLGDYKFKFDITKLYATDLTTKGNYESKRISNAQATPNDIRRENDTPPVPGGDETFISCNIAPITSEKISGKARPSPKKSKGDDDSGIQKQLNESN